MLEVTPKRIGGWRVAPLGAALLTACVGPSGNLGEPAQAGSLALTLDTRTVRDCTRVRFVDQVQGEVDAQLASEDGITCNPAQTLALAVPAAVGVRYGLAKPLDVGLSIGQSASGVNTRVRFLGGPRQFSGVWTVDARKGYRALDLYDLHSRLLFFAPLGPVRLMFGGGASFGTWQHFATTSLARSETEPERAHTISRDETRVDVALGFGPKNGVVYAFIDPYWVVRHGPIESIDAPNVVGFELESAVVVGFAMTLPVWPESPREALSR